MRRTLLRLPLLLLRRCLTLGLTLSLAGCASAGGTAGIFDTGSVWYKHPTTGDVKECGGGVYPGVQIRRRACGKTLISVGYTEVEKCKVAAAGAPCVTDDEIARAEAEERKR